MARKRLLLIVAASLTLIAAFLVGVYLSATWDHDAAPAYTRPAKPVDAWDGPAAAP